jgi:hypothetical protein
MTKRRQSTKALNKKLDNVIRDILKIKAGDNPKCFVTGVYTNWFHPTDNPKGLQVGHYVSRRVYPLRWDLKNVFPQTSSSNYTHQHNQLPFTARILEVYGKKRIEYLNEKYEVYKRRGKSMTRKEKEELLTKLQEQLNGLQKST